MARENQGLQIALIVFVMLTIALGVSSYLCFSKYQESLVKVKTHTDEAKKANDLANDRLGEIKDLRGMLGVAETEKIADLQEQFKKDMETWAGTFPQNMRKYRLALQYIFTALKNTNTTLAEAKSEIQQWKDKYAAREAATVPRIVQFQTAATKSAEDAGTHVKQVDDQLRHNSEVQSKAAALLASARKETEAASSKLEQTTTQYTAHVQDLTGKLKTIKGELDHVKTETPTAFSGEVRWVDQRARTVWINLGRADALNRLTSFNVYPGDTIDLSKAVKKGSVEITQLLGEHMAEARVVDDKDIDPILPGDKIYTPTWSPGEQKHFALAGIMDIDGDGVNNQAKVRNMITASGGVVDAEVDEKGKRQGAMSLNTRYFIQGTAPDAKRTPEWYQGYSRMIGEADRLNITKISVSRLLEMIGYQKRSKVVQFGPGGNASEIPPDAAAGRRASTSDVFKERKPPQPTAGSAY